MQEHNYSNKDVPSDGLGHKDTLRAHTLSLGQSNLKGK